MFKVQSIKINVHNQEDRQIHLFDDETGIPMELGFKPGRITTGFCCNATLRMFDYYGREIQIDDSIAEFIEQTGRLWLNEDQETFLVKLKDGSFAIASVVYYYSHSGGRKQKWIEYNSRLNPEYANKLLGQIWLEPKSRRIFRSYDRNVVKDSCIGYFLEKIDQNPKEYWLLDTDSGETIIYRTTDDSLLPLAFFPDASFTNCIIEGPVTGLSNFTFDKDRRGFTCFAEINGETRKFGTSLDIIDRYFLFTKKKIAYASLPLIYM